MTKLYKKIAIPVIILAVIALSLIYGTTPYSKDVTETTAEDKTVTEVSVKDEPKKDTESAEIPPEVSPQKTEDTAAPVTVSDVSAKSEETVNPVAEVVQVKPAETASGNSNPTCSLSVRCDSILVNMDKLKKEKVNYVPSDGKIYENANAVFHEGETAFNLLIRELRNNSIHYEFVRTPIYNSSYIEGIGNLYEFDCGEQSGWTYKVNGKAPPHGCSQYKIEDNDVIEFIYTCSCGS